jgi:hypothetical protein
LTHNAHSFVCELGAFYAVGGSEKDKAERFDKYATLIAEEVSKLKCKFNYDKLLKYFELTKEKFPSVAEVIANLPIGIEKSFSGREGETIKRILNGHEYEFTVVPNHWSGIMTISELDRDIARRSSRDGEIITESEGV